MKKLINIILIIIFILGMTIWVNKQLNDMTEDYNKTKQFVTLNIS